MTAEEYVAEKCSVMLTDLAESLVVVYEMSEQDAWDAVIAVVEQQVNRESMWHTLYGPDQSAERAVRAAS